MTNKKFLNGLIITLLQLVRSLLRIAQNHPSLHWSISQKSTRVKINSSLNAETDGKIYNFRKTEKW